MVGREFETSRRLERRQAASATWSWRSTTSGSTAIAARPPVKGVSSRSARARSSPSPGSPVTDSASSPRRSPACAAVERLGPRRRPAPPRRRPARARSRRASRYVPEDRLGTGVAPDLSIAMNLALKSYRQDSLGPLLRLRRMRRARRRRRSARYDIKAPGPGDRRPATSPAATSRSSCSPASSPAAEGADRRVADARPRRRRDRGRAPLPDRRRRARRRPSC